MTQFREMAHLYLGCEWEWKQYVGLVSDGVYRTDFFNSKLLREIAFSNGLAKPILRPLSDMTDEEAKQLCEYFGVYGDMPGRRTYETYRNGYGELIVSWGSSIREKWSPFRCNNWTSDQFAYLLKQGFDLFGLIKSGQAIDKTIQP